MNPLANKLQDIAADEAARIGTNAVEEAAQHVPAGVVVPPTAIAQQLKGQLRIGIAALGGALVLRHVLPAWAVNDQTVDYVVGIVTLGAAAAWSWARQRLIHSRFASLALDPRVPDDAAKMAGK